MEDFSDPLEEDPDDSNSPLPLAPTLPPSEPFPVEALGALRQVTESLSIKLQVPIELVAHNILAVASLATQGFADVTSPFGGTYPLSLCMLTVLGSGSRNALIENYSLFGVIACEKKVQNDILRRLQEKNSIDESNLENNIDRLLMRGMYRLSGIRFEDLLRNAPHLPGALLYQSTDLSQFTGATKGAAKFKQSQAGINLSKLLAGDNIFITHGSKSQLIRGRRLTVSLSIEDKLATEILKTDHPGTHILLSKALTCWPDSLVGRRKPAEVRSDEISGLEWFSNRIEELLYYEDTTLEKFNELSPPTLRLDGAAVERLASAFRYFEENSIEGKQFALVSGFTANCAEIICRIAGIMTIFEDIDEKYIGVTAINNAWALFIYYARQLARVQETVVVNEEIADAQRLLTWLQDRCVKAHKETGHECVLQRYILQHAHPTLRSLERCERALDILEKHRWIYRREGRRMVCIRYKPPQKKV